MRRMLWLLVPAILTSLLIVTGLVGNTWLQMRPQLVNPDRFPNWPASSDQPNVYLHLSNQSFDIPYADVLVEVCRIGLNGTTKGYNKLFRSGLRVGNQHEWVHSAYVFPPGRFAVYCHELSTGAVGYYRLTMDATDSVHLVVQFWSNTWISPSAYFTINASETFAFL